MERKQRGGWVYITADRYRGTMYVGVTSELSARINQHRCRNGSGFCAKYRLRQLVGAQNGNSIEDTVV